MSESGAGDASVDFAQIPEYRQKIRPVLQTVVNLANQIVDEWSKLTTEETNALKVVPEKLTELATQALGELSKLNTRWEENAEPNSPLRALKSLANDLASNLAGLLSNSDFFTLQSAGKFPKGLLIYRDPMPQLLSDDSKVTWRQALPRKATVEDQVARIATALAAIEQKLSITSSGDPAATQGSTPAALAALGSSPSGGTESGRAAAPRAAQPPVVSATRPTRPARRSS